MKLSVNLVTLNGEKYLPYLLESLRNQTYKDYELLVIDNGSVDKTVDYLEKEWEGLKIIKNQKNIGFASGHNHAIKLSKGEYILMLNQDIILAPDIFEQAIKFLDKNDKIGALQPKLYRWKFTSDKDVIDQEKTNIIDSVGLEVFKNFRIIEKGTGNEDREEYDSVKEVFGVTGALPFFRRQALEDVKFKEEYLDDLFVSYKEDVDLSWRLKLRDWKIVYYPKTFAYHARGVESNKDFSNSQVSKNRKQKSDFANYNSYKNHLIMLIKNLTFKNMLKYGIFIGWYELKKFIYLILFEQKTLKGLFEIFKNWKLIWAKRKFIQANRKAEIGKWIH